MFGHKRNFIYGYVCGKLDKHIMSMKFDTSIDVDVYIAAKYFLPKKYIGKYLSPDVDVRLKACNRFKNRYRNLRQRINQHITNVFNPGIKITSLLSPALVVRFLTTSTTWEAPKHILYHT